MDFLHVYSVLLLLASQAPRHIATRISSDSRCQKVQLAYGSSHIQRQTGGKIISYKCYRGYMMRGKPYSACIRGQWKPDPPVCLKSGCSSIRNFRNGHITSKMRSALLEFSCNPGYKLVGPSVLYCNGRRWNTLQPYCKAADIRCNFESDTTCSWFVETHDDDDFMWNIQQREMSSRLLGTGPKRDHTFPSNDTGHYIMIDTGDYGSETKVLPARIHSPKFPPPSSNDTCFTFWYHMFGSTIGMLNVFLNNRVVFQERGNHGDRWIKAAFPLPVNETDLEIMIEATHGGGHSGNIALDDFSVGNGTECIYSKVRSCAGRCSEEADESALCLCHPECYVDSSCCNDYDDFCAGESTASSSDDTFGTDATMWEHSTAETTYDSESQTEDVWEETTPYSGDSESERQSTRISIQSFDASSETSTTTNQQPSTSSPHTPRVKYSPTNEKSSTLFVFPSSDNSTTNTNRAKTTVLFSTGKLTSVTEKSLDSHSYVTTTKNNFKTTQLNDLDINTSTALGKTFDSVKSAENPTTKRTPEATNKTLMQQSNTTSVKPITKGSISPSSSTVITKPQQSQRDITVGKATTKYSIFYTTSHEGLKSRTFISRNTPVELDSKTTSLPKSTGSMRSKTTTFPKVTINIWSQTTALPKSISNIRTITTASTKATSNTRPITTASPKSISNIRTITTASTKARSNTRPITTASPKYISNIRTITTASTKARSNTRPITTASPKSISNIRTITTASTKARSNIRPITTASPKSISNIRTITTASTKARSNTRSITTASPKSISNIRTITAASPKFTNSTRSTTMTIPKSSSNVKASTFKMIFPPKPTIVFSTVAAETTTPSSFVRIIMSKNNTHRFSVNKKPFSTTVKPQLAIKYLNDGTPKKPTVIREDKSKRGGSTASPAKATTSGNTTTPVDLSTTQATIFTNITKGATVALETTFKPTLAWGIHRTEANVRSGLQQTKTKMSSILEEKKIVGSRENNILKGPSLKWKPVNTSQEEYLSHLSEERTEESGLDKVLLVGALTVLLVTVGCLAGFLLSRRRTTRHRLTNDSEADVLYASSEEMLDLHPARPNIL